MVPRHSRENWGRTCCESRLLSFFELLLARTRKKTSEKGIPEVNEKGE